MSSATQDIPHLVSIPSLFLNWERTPYHLLFSVYSIDQSVLIQLQTIDHFCVQNGLRVHRFTNWGGGGGGGVKGAGPLTVSK